MRPNELEILSLRPRRTQKSVLSVYLNVDQSVQSNLNKGYRRRLQKQRSRLLRSASSAKDRELLETALQRVDDFLEGYTPADRRLILFVDVTDRFFWKGEANFRTPDTLRWDNELLLQPLLNAADDMEAYGVILADRTSFRLFHVFLGTIKELGEQQPLGTGRTRHIKAVGMDHWGSASRVQRKADEQVKLNLREVAAAAGRLMRTRRLRRLILAGTPEVTAELRGLLSKPVERAVVAAVHLPMRATLAEILRATRPLADQYERGTEETSVERVITTAAKKGQAVIGLRHTLEAVNAGRVWQLMYSSDFQAPGFECKGCGALFTAKASTCSFCKAKPRRVRNVVEHAVEHAKRKGSKIEVVSGAPSRTLKRAGGIGALLKVRTGTRA